MESDISHYTHQYLDIESVPEYLLIHSNIWTHPELLRMFSEACECFVKVLIIFKNREIVASLPVYYRKIFGFKYSFNPIQVTYIPITFFYEPKNKIQENKQTEYEIMAYMSKIIYKDFVKAEFKLSPDNFDMRPFKHKKVSISPLYTFYIETSQQNYTYNQVKNIKKAKKINLNIVANSHPDLFSHPSPSTSSQYESQILNQLNLLKERMDKKGLWQNSRDKTYRKLLKLSVNKPFIKNYSIYFDQNLIAFRTIITDQKNKSAYDWFTASNNFAMQNGVNSLLMDYVINDLHENGINTFDLCGANIPSIAKFKNDFGGNLKVYFFIKKKI